MRRLLAPEFYILKAHTAAKNGVAFLRRVAFSKGAFILRVTTFGSYVMGLFRDRIFSHTFGADRNLDLYNAAFTIPDLLLNILIASALSAAFIPIFSTLLGNKEDEKAQQLANTTLHASLLVIFIAGSLCAIFMTPLVQFIAPGFSPDEKLKLVALSRLMLISPLIITLSSMFGEMLISFKRFLAYGLSPMLYNFGIILGGVFLVPIFGVYGLVLGTLVGALLHLLPRFIAIFKTPYKYKFSFNYKDINFRRMVRLTIPKMIGQPIEQLTFFSFNRIASLLAVGSITALSFARNFQSVPVALFGISISVAALPLLSQAWGKNDMVDFKKHFKKSLLGILLLTIPSAIGLYILSDLPIKIFLGGGKFSDENILRTAKVLSIFALSIPAESLIHLFARGFYALKNTIIPVLLSVIGFSITVTYAALKAPFIGLIALPYGFFLGSLVQLLLLALILRRFIIKRSKSSHSAFA